MVVFVGIVLLVVGEERIELEALLEVLRGLEATDVLEHVEVTVGVSASLDKSVPVDTLQTHVSVIFLELEVHGAVEADVRSLDGVHVFTSHLELVKVEVFWEHLHFYYNKINLIYNNFPFFQKITRISGVLGFWGFFW